MKRIFSILIILFVCGCVNEKIEIHSTRQWEGRYEDSEKLNKAINGIKLEKGESVWVMKNDTLYRILENYRNKGK